jgi:hypothetical protein
MQNTKNKFKGLSLDEVVRMALESESNVDGCPVITVMGCEYYVIAWLGDMGNKSEVRGCDLNGPIDFVTINGDTLHTPFVLA